VAQAFLGSCRNWYSYVLNTILAHTARKNVYQRTILPNLSRKILSPMNPLAASFVRGIWCRGNPGKEGDDLLSATRYAVMMLRHARTMAGYRRFHGDIRYPNLGLA
jgi:hypothetical protein